MLVSLQMIGMMMAIQLIDQEIIPRSIYKPLPWQVNPWRDKSHTLLLSGSAGGGKSRLASEKIHALMLKYPGATGVVGRKDKTSANKSVVQVMRKTVQGSTEWGIYNKTDGVFKYANGSRLWVVGTKDEAQRETLRSIGKDGSVDFAWFEEANKLTEQDHNEILGRTRGATTDWVQLIYTTNPDHPQHWIHQRLIKGQEATVIYSGAKDNPYLPDHYMETLEKLTGVQYQRLVKGLWVQAEGAVFDEYSEDVHHIKPFEPPKDGRYIVGIDFGFTNPLVCSLWYIDNDDRMYLYKQIYFSRRIVEDHAPHIKAMVGERKVEAWITDHDAEDRATLEKHLDIRTTAAYKSVSPGIQAVKQRFVVQEDGKARIFFMRNAVENVDPRLEETRKPVCTVDEIPGYIWEQSREGHPIKEKPVKINDHGVDEMRYVAAYVDDLAGDHGIEITDNPFYD